MKELKVEWLDAIGYQDEFTHKEAKDLLLCRRVDYGVELVNNDKFITIAPGILNYPATPSGDKKETRYERIIVIPKAWVTKIIDMTDKT